MTPNTVPPKRSANSPRLWGRVLESMAAGEKSATRPKRTLLVEILGLPIAAVADSPRPHEMVAAREILRERMAERPRLAAVVGDRAYRGLAPLAARKGVSLDIKAPPPGPTGLRADPTAGHDQARVRPAGPLATVVALRRGLRRLSPAWLEVASVGYLAWRASV